MNKLETQIREDAAKLEAANDLNDLCALHKEWIGYDPREDEGWNQDPEEMRDDLKDYLVEQCYAAGLHVQEIFPEWNKD